MNEMNKPANKAADSLIARIQTDNPITRVNSASAVTDDFLSRHKKKTQESYRRVFKHFADWIMVPWLDAARQLLNQPNANEANRLLLSYRNELMKQQFAPKTINLHMAAIKSFVQLAKIQGLINWTVDIRGLKIGPANPVGLTEEQISKLLAAAKSHKNKAKCARDEAILWMLCSTAFRREEIVTLELEHYDEEKGRVQIMGKARDEREWCTLPKQAHEALQKWLKFRGREPGRLLTNLSRCYAHSALTGRGVLDIIQKLGEKAGIEVYPHMLRHAGGQIGYSDDHDIRAVSKLLRHRSIETTMIYADTAEDVAGKLAQSIADRISKANQEEKPE